MLLGQKQGAERGWDGRVGLLAATYLAGRGMLAQPWVPYSPKAMGPVMTQEELRGDR